MPKERQRRVSELRRETFHGLPVMLVDALGEMAELGIDPTSITPLDRFRQRERPRDGRLHVRSAARAADGDRQPRRSATSSLRHGRE
jgi:hypothetical protein